MKRVLGYLIGLLLLPASGVAEQNERIYLAPVEWNSDVSIVPTISRDHRFLAIPLDSASRRAAESPSWNPDPPVTTLLFDMQSGQLLRRFKNKYMQFALERFGASPGVLLGPQTGNPREQFDAATLQELAPLASPNIEGRVGKAWGDYFYTEARELVGAVITSKTFFYKRRGRTYDRISEFPFGFYPDRSDSGEAVALGTQESSKGRMLVAFDVLAGNELWSYPIPAGQLSFFLIDGVLIVPETFSPKPVGFAMPETKTKLHFVNPVAGEVLQTLILDGYAITYVLSADERRLVFAAGGGDLILIDVPTRKVIASTSVGKHDLLTKGKPNVSVQGVFYPHQFDGQGRYILGAGRQSGMMQVISTEDLSVAAEVFVDEEDWAVVARDGRVDGTPGAFRKLQWVRIDSRGQVIGKTRLDSTIAAQMSPGLLYSIIQGSVREQSQIVEQLKQAPQVEIIGPQEGFKTEEGFINLKLRVRANTDPIQEILVFVNDKRIANSIRGLSVKSRATHVINVPLIPGNNLISVRAVTEKDYESESVSLAVHRESGIRKSSLFVLSIGLDQYKNQSYNLNYAVADANAFTNLVKGQTGGIYESVVEHRLLNDQATRQGILSVLEAIAAEADADDTFIFFYAGHGVLDEESTTEFFLALHGVTQLYGQSDLLRREAISAEELKHHTSQIAAQKQLIILDACQSGGAVDSFIRRGAAEERAIIQLARSAGVTLMASTGSEQFATEFEDLGHGVFTYSILQGMSGQADGGSRDGKITIRELDAYLNDEVPRLTQKYKGVTQYPRSWSQGMDFPLVIAN